MPLVPKANREATKVEKQQGRMTIVRHCGKAK
jgi:hypothetical protein